MFLWKRRGAGFILADNVRSDENDEFFLHGGAECAREEFAQARNVAQEGDFLLVSSMLGLDQAPENDGCSVPHANQRRGLFGVQNGSGGGFAGRDFGGYEAGQYRRDVE